MTRNAEISVIRKETYDYSFFFDQQKKTGLEHRLSSLESSTGSINANFRNRRFTAILLFYDFLTLFFRSQGHIRPVYNLQRPFRYLYIFGALLNTELMFKNRLYTLSRKREVELWPVRIEQSAKNVKTKFSNLVIFSRLRNWYSVYCSQNAADVRCNW